MGRHSRLILTPVIDAMEARVMLSAGPPLIGGLVHTTAQLSRAPLGIAATSVGNYPIFAGGELATFESRRTLRAREVRKELRMPSDDLPAQWAENFVDFPHERTRQRNPRKSRHLGRLSRQM